MEKILRAISRLYWLILGSKSPRSVDRVSVHAWEEALSGDLRSVLRKQLGQLRLVQEQAEGQKVCFYYKEGEHIPLFSPVIPDMNAATLILKCGADVEEGLIAQIFVHRGLFFSIEYSEEPEKYALRHGAAADAFKAESVVILRSLSKA